MKDTSLRVAHALVFLALDLWLGLVGLLMVALGTSLAAAFAVTVVPGLFFISGTLQGARALGAVKLTHLRLAGGPALSAPPPAAARSGFWGRLTGPMRDQAGWKAFAYWWVELFLALVSFAAVFGLISTGLVAVTLPLYANRLPGVGGDVPLVGLVLSPILGAIVVAAGLIGADGPAGSCRPGPGVARPRPDRGPPGSGHQP